MGRKIFYAPSTIKALGEKLIGQLTEQEILDITEVAMQNVLRAVENKDICLGVGDLVHSGIRTFFVNIEWDVCENCDYYVVGGEVRELSITKDRKVKNERLCKVGYLREDEYEQRV